MKSLIALFLLAPLMTGCAALSNLDLGGVLGSGDPPAQELGAITTAYMPDGSKVVTETGFLALSRGQEESVAKCYEAQAEKYKSQGREAKSEMSQAFSEMADITRSLANGANGKSADPCRQFTSVNDVLVVVRQKNSEDTKERWGFLDNLATKALYGFGAWVLGEVGKDAVDDDTATSLTVDGVTTTTDTPVVLDPTIPEL